MKINNHHLAITIFFLITIVSFFGIGILFNNLVISANNNKMPVLTTNLNPCFYCTHFQYQNSKDINLSLLADNYKISNKIYSIGDGYIFSAMIIFIIYLIFLLISYLTIKTK